MNAMAAMELGAPPQQLGPLHYNHWLITMGFPKDPKPTPEEMVEMYVQTLAKVVGSVEEAKKRMYACSTTTYNGFQAVMTEEMSKKFRGNKYDNGVITPRPPPVQYGRQRRYGDRNRNYDRPRYDRQRDAMPMQQGNPSFDRQGPPQGDGRSFAPQQNYGQDRQGYGPPGGGNYAPERRENFPGGRDGYTKENEENRHLHTREGLILDRVEVSHHKNVETSHKGNKGISQIRNLETSHKASRYMVVRIMGKVQVLGMVEVTGNVDGQGPSSGYDYINCINL